jgi:hypothetical protein
MKKLLLMVGITGALALVSLGTHADAAIDSSVTTDQRVQAPSDNICTPQFEQLCSKLCAEKGCDFECIPDLGCECVFGNGKSCPG